MTISLCKKEFCFEFHLSVFEASISPFNKNRIHLGFEAAIAMNNLGFRATSP